VSAPAADQSGRGGGEPENDAPSERDQGLVAVSARLVKTKTPGIYKRGGRYVASWRDNHGRQRTQSAANLGEAKAIRAANLADVMRGEYRAISKVTFRDYAPDWYAGYQGRTSRGLREATKEGYGRELGIDPTSGECFDPPRGAVAFFGRIRLAEIEPQHLKRYAATLAARGLAPNTIRLALVPVKLLLATAYEEGLIRSNPAQGLRLTTQPNRAEPDEDKVKALSEEELARVLAQVPERWLLPFTLLAQSGLRASELLPLRWGDIDFGRRKLKVRRSLSRGRLGPPKTRHGRRDVPLTQQMSQQLWNLRKTGGNPADEALIFTRPDGQPHSRTQLFRVIHTAGKQAGLPWVGLHTLRHTAATILFRRGWNAVQVQKLLGHHSPAFTLNTYVHLLSEDLPEPDFLAPLPRAGASEDSLGADQPARPAYQPA
jgi:integrase